MKSWVGRDPGGSGLGVRMPVCMIPSYFKLWGHVGGARFRDLSSSTKVVRDLGFGVRCLVGFAQIAILTPRCHRA